MSQTLDRIRPYFRKHFQLNKTEFIPGKTRIPLTVPTYGAEEVEEAVDSLLSTWVTMGAKVKKFEEAFAQYNGSKHAVMVNSGSSANLLALSVLTNPSLPDHIEKGSEIITPAVTWATTVYPIANVGCTPVLVDVDPQTFNILPEETEKAVTAKTDKEAAQVYPGNYWLSLMAPPDKSLFPGTGGQGNGIGPGMLTQNHWINQLKSGCNFCHQLGNKLTRTLDDVYKVETAIKTPFDA